MWYHSKAYDRYKSCIHGAKGNIWVWIVTLMILFGVYLSEFWGDLLDSRSNLFISGEGCNTPLCGLTVGICVLRLFVHCGSFCLGLFRYFLG
jgi:hypothetical protein